MKHRYVAAYSNDQVWLSELPEFVPEHQIKRIMRTELRVAPAERTSGYRLMMVDGSSFYARSLRPYTIEEAEAEFDRLIAASRPAEYPIT